jgi:hypothetical protein
MFIPIIIATNDPENMVNTGFTAIQDCTNSKNYTSIHKTFCRSNPTIN